MRKEEYHKQTQFVAHVVKIMQTRVEKRGLALRHQTEISKIVDREIEAR